MADPKKSKDRLHDSLQKRARELNCLYQISEALSRYDESLDNICHTVAQLIPSGWQYPEICRVQLTLEEKIYYSPSFAKSEWMQEADIKAHGRVIGYINVYYTQTRPGADHGPFLHEEARLLDTIAGRLGRFIEYQRRLRIALESQRTALDELDDTKVKWKKVLEVLTRSDRELYLKIARKLMNHMCMTGIDEAKRLLQSSSSETDDTQEKLREDRNIPYRWSKLSLSDDFSVLAFKLAAKHLSDDKIQALIQKWVLEEKLSHLDRVINSGASLVEVSQAIRRYYPLESEEPIALSAHKRGIQVSLIRRLFSDQLQYVNTAKNFIEVRDVYRLLDYVVCCTGSQGKLGGKSAGMHLAAQILKKKGADSELLKNVKIPKTWHISSDAMHQFVHYNGFGDVVEQKYKETGQIELEFPYIVQTFKSAQFPPEIVHGLTVALDDFGERPLIVRSSSLLEDRVGAAFSGKYRSLFLANQGSRQDRLDALLDAVAEVYASTFSPDAIEYRAERGLLDFVEEMGIMIQEVVGRRIGRYFLPTFAGVAFSHNEFRWSPRIKREDGLVRLVPGLGTRAVDRLSDDYPILIAPGQPQLRVNVSTDEIVRYSPREIDVINLETNSYETKKISEFLAEVGHEFPGIGKMISVLSDYNTIRPVGMETDLATANIVVTCDGLISQTPFVTRMRTILETLEQELGMPVDIEFGSDGENLYLLQCRPQSSSSQSLPVEIPKGLPADQIVFSANRYISHGHVSGITHIVYVLGRGYERLADRTEMLAVGRAVGKLNRLLPKRRFILMGPGRWGSKGDIKLGVNVTYADINNTAILIEIAHKKGDYLPDLSFGTHFFQDLVEANIGYLPLYPGIRGTVFNDRFLEDSPNILSDLLPESSSLADTLRVIDVPAGADGRVLNVVMNADQGEALGFLADPSV